MHWRKEGRFWLVSEAPLHETQKNKQKKLTCSFNECRSML